MQGSATLESYLFLIIAQQWPGIMKIWSEVDIKMINYGSPKNLKLRLKLATVGFITTAFCNTNIIIISFLLT